MCQRCGGRTAENDGRWAERMQQDVRVKGGRWAEEIPQRWRQPKGEDRTEMKKEAKLLRCTLLNGSAWKGKCDIFFGIEHRLRKEGAVQ